MKTFIIIAIIVIAIIYLVIGYGLCKMSDEMKLAYNADETWFQFLINKWSIWLLWLPLVCIGLVVRMFGLDMEEE